MKSNRENKLIIFNELVPKYLELHKQINSLIEELYGEGTPLIWIDGKYKGRTAEVHTVHWDIGFDGKLEINAHVKTSRAKGEGFIDHWDDYHRRLFMIGDMIEVRRGLET